MGSSEKVQKSKEQKSRSPEEQKYKSSKGSRTKRI